MKFDCSRAGSPTARMSGIRLNSSWNITVISRRARWAPRQKCGPGPPKPRWSFGVRPRSKRNGSSNTAASRLAEAYQSTTLSPSLKVLVADAGAVLR